jgi:type III pantothenate kinase
MLLAIDAGNTNIVFALVKAREIRARWRIATDPRRTADEYVVWLRELLELEGYTSLDVDAVMIGTVVPRATHNLQVLASKYFGVEALIAGQGEASWPIALEVDEPHNVGADRALNAIAAHAKYEGDLIIVDFGTATTFDAISAKGEYLGGVICPGPQISADALFQRAARLPRIEVRKPDRIIGTNTVGSMQSGLFWGYVDMVDGLVRRMRTELGGNVAVVATGGLAESVAPETTVVEHVDPELTLRGLRIVWDRNHSGS